MDLSNPSGSTMQGHIHWAQPFINRLNNRVKLVGSAISCEGVPEHGDMLGSWRRNPHVQSYAFATDKVSAAGRGRTAYSSAMHSGRSFTLTPGFGLLLIGLNRQALRSCKLRNASLHAMGVSGITCSTASWAPQQLY